MCSSLDTLSRVVQQQVKIREQKGPEKELCPLVMMIVSADNIDFLHSYAGSYYGRQSTSWHGTTIQVVQPRPSLPLVGQLHAGLVCPMNVTSCSLSEMQRTATSLVSEVHRSVVSTEVSEVQMSVSSRCRVQLHHL